MTQKLGKYTLVEKLGEGAMGSVYKAYDDVLDRYVAVKTMAEDIKWDPELKVRFYREARSAAGLHHPNIVTIHDLGEDGKITYIVMELLQGQDLKSIIKNQAPLPVEKKLSIIAQVADGLHHAHLSGIIHRDVKPGNIHVSPSGNVKIVDFGIARIPASDLTRSGTRLGTPIYMSPEQIRGGDYDERSDMFSTGIVFYELITYQHPFRDKNIAKTLDNILFLTRLPFHELAPDSPPGLLEIINSCLAKEPAQRYGSMAEVGKACRNLLVDLNLSSQKSWKELQEALPQIRQAVSDGRAAPRLAQLMQQIDTIGRQEEKPDYSLLRRMKAVLAEESSAVAAGAATTSPPPDRAAAKPAPSAPGAEELRGQEALETGKRLLSEGRLEEALQLLRQSLALVGPREDLLQAIAETRRLIDERNAAKVSQLMSAAEAALAAKEFHKALDALGEARAHEPEGPRLLEMRRKVLSEMEAEQARRKRLEEGQRVKALGMQLAADGNYRESRKQLELAIELLGADLEVRQALARVAEFLQAEELRARINVDLGKARQFLSSGSFDDARRHGRRALESAPDHAEARQLLAAIDEAEAEKRKAAEIATHLSRGREALQAQQFDAAAAAAGEILKLDAQHAAARDLRAEVEKRREEKLRLEKIAVLLNECQEYLRKLDYDNAAARANSILEIDPQSTRASELLGQIEQAREAKRKLDEIEALLRRGREALEQESFTDAKALAEQALSLNSADPRTREFLKRIDTTREESRKRHTLLGLLNQAQQAFLRGELDEAERLARQTLQLDPRFDKALDLVARIEEDRAKRRKNEAAERLARAREFLQDSDIAQARACALEADAIEPGNEELGHLLEELDRTEERLRQQQIAALIEQGREALGVQQWDRASRLADEALSLDPRSKPARSLVKEIRNEQRKQEKRRAREEKRLQRQHKQGKALADSAQAPVSDQTVVLPRPPHGNSLKYALWSASALVLIAVSTGLIYWFFLRGAPADDFADRLAAARTSLLEKRLDEAITAAQGILSADPGNLAARSILDEAAKLKKQSRIDSLLLEAQTLKSEGRLEESLKTTEQILELDPASQPGLTLQSEIQGMMAASASDAEKAVLLKDWIARARRFLAAERLTEARAEIIKIAQAASQAPELPELNKLLASKSAQLARREHEAQLAVERKGRLEEISRQADQLFRSGKYAEAQPVLEQWLALAPADSAALDLRRQNQLALQSLRTFETQLDQKRYDDALRALAQLEKVNAADPSLTELRRRLDARRAAAHATVSVYRLGPPATLLMDERPFGQGGEAEAVSLPIGQHRLAVQNSAGRQVERNLDLFEGQNIALVYDSSEPLLRFMQEADRELLRIRRIREEVHVFDAEHRHTFGKCTGQLLISGVTVSYKGSEHSFTERFLALRISIRDDRIEMRTRDNKRNWDFKVKDASVAAQIGILWENLLQLGK